MERELNYIILLLDYVLLSIKLNNCMEKKDTST